MIDEQIKKPGINPFLKKNLEREKFEAELSRGINQYRLADTYVGSLDTKEKLERSDLLGKARDIFSSLSNASRRSRILESFLSYDMRPISRFSFIHTCS